MEIRKIELREAESKIDSNINRFEAVERLFEVNSSLLDDITNTLRTTKPLLEANSISTEEIEDAIDWTQKGAINWSKSWVETGGEFADAVESLREAKTRVLEAEVTG